MVLIFTLGVDKTGETMLTVIELLIGVVVIVGVARYIIKGYSATGVLFVGGLVLLIISALMGHKGITCQRNQYRLYRNRYC